MFVPDIKLFIKSFYSPIIFIEDLVNVGAQVREQGNANNWDKVIVNL